MFFDCLCFIFYTILVTGLFAVMCIPFIVDPPVFPDVPATITLQEGTNASGNFTVISNPPPTEYKWFKVNRMYFPAFE